MFNLAGIAVYLEPEYYKVIIRKHWLLYSKFYFWSLYLLRKSMKRLN